MKKVTTSNNVEEIRLKQEKLTIIVGLIDSLQSRLEYSSYYYEKDEEGNETDNVLPEYELDYKANVDVQKLLYKLADSL